MIDGLISPERRRPQIYMVLYVDTLMEYDAQLRFATESEAYEAAARINGHGQLAPPLVTVGAAYGEDAD